MSGEIGEIEIVIYAPTISYVDAYMQIANAHLT